MGNKTSKKSGNHKSLKKKEIMIFGPFFGGSYAFLTHLKFLYGIIDGELPPNDEIPAKILSYIIRHVKGQKFPQNELDAIKANLFNYERGLMLGQKESFDPIIPFFEKYCIPLCQTLQDQNLDALTFYVENIRKIPGMTCGHEDLVSYSALFESSGFLMSTFPAFSVYCQMNRTYVTEKNTDKYQGRIFFCNLLDLWNLQRRTWKPPFKKPFELSSQFEDYWNNNWKGNEQAIDGNVAIIFTHLDKLVNEIGPKEFGEVVDGFSSEGSLREMLDFIREQHCKLLPKRVFAYYVNTFDVYEISKVIPKLLDVLEIGDTFKPQDLSQSRLRVKDRVCLSEVSLGATHQLIKKKYVDIHFTFA